MGRNVVILVGALLLAGSVVAAGMLVRAPLERGTEELAAVKTSLASLEEAVKSAAAPRAQAAAATGRPDPAQRYSVSTDGSPAVGPANAQVSVVAFSDFQCPFCSRAVPTLEQVEKKYGDRVRIVFKHLPLSMHPKAPAAHAAAEAAHRQGKFWEMHDLIFGNQREMSPERYVQYATELGLDVDKFKKDVESAEVKKRIDDDTSEASRLNVRGTPAFFINGRYLSGAQPFETFKQRIDEELASGGTQAKG
jgi:protein-disulfide isomerase